MVEASRIALYHPKLWAKQERQGCKIVPPPVHQSLSASLHPSPEFSDLNSDDLTPLSRVA